MRADMQKVIVEPPRHGRSYAAADKTVRKIKRINVVVDEEGVPDVFDCFSGVKKSMRPGRWTENCKEFSDDLNPLYRFLRRRLGKPWNKVYSEICSVVDRRSTTGDHVFLHLKDMVAVNSYMEGEKLVVVNRWGPGSDYYQFYVHPESGLLCEKPYRKFRWPAVPPVHTIKDADQPTRGFLKRPSDGTWFYVEVVDPTTRNESDLGCIDIFTHKHPRHVRAYWNKYEFLYGYKGRKYVTRLLRTASKKEIRDYKLNA